MSIENLERERHVYGIAMPEIQNYPTRLNIGLYGPGSILGLEDCLMNVSEKQYSSLVSCHSLKATVFRF